MTVLLSVRVYVGVCFGLQELQATVQDLQLQASKLPPEAPTAVSPRLGTVGILFKQENGAKIIDRVKPDSNAESNLQVQYLVFTMVYSRATK